MRAPFAFLPMLGLLACRGMCQPMLTNAPPAANSPPSHVENEPEKSWSFSASVYTYIVTDDKTYAQPTITADRSWLHLEARYNSEDLETGSVWMGYNFSVGDKLSLKFTPMLGGVFGHTTGLAPGYKGSVSWWKLALYSEGEYVYVPGARADSFFYNWSELTLSPVDWFRFGIVTQRTRVYASDRDIKRGPLVGFSFKQFDLAAYVLSPDAHNPTVVVAVAVKF